METSGITPLKLCTSGVRAPPACAPSRPASGKAEAFLLVPMQELVPARTGKLHAEQHGGGEARRDCNEAGRRVETGGGRISNIGVPYPILLPRPDPPTQGNGDLYQQYCWHGPKLLHCSCLGLPWGQMSPYTQRPLAATGCSRSCAGATASTLGSLDRMGFIISITS